MSSRGGSEFFRTPLPNYHESLNENPTRDSEKCEGESLVVFAIDRSLFAIASAFIKAISPVPSITSLPFLKPSGCIGFSQFNGKAFPVTEVRQLVGMPVHSRKDTKNLPQARLLIVEHFGLLTGLVADSVLGVACLPKRIGTRKLGLLTVSESRLEDKATLVIDAREFTESCSLERGI